MVQRVERVLARPAEVVFVAELTPHGVVGWLHGAEQELLESGARCEILGLVVDPDHRGGGVGRRLVAAVEQWAALRGLGQMAVRSNVVRAESHPFYERLGYVRVKTQHAYRKRLANQAAAPMRRLAPEIFRKRLLIEGYFARRQVDAQAIRDYFTVITTRLGLRTYGAPIVHETRGQGKATNEGYDAFVPLIDSGIYVCVWSGRRFASAILYTCAEFDEADATAATREFFEMTEWDTVLF